MSVRESRGRARGRGRGRGARKTMDWTWESYTPSPAVYASLWYPRREPATVTPYPPTQCPVPNAQTRIIDRRQTEGDFSRNLYVVEIVTDGDMDDLENEGLQKIEVDSSRILEFVSPSELERFENEMFRAEGEILAVAEKAEEEDRIRRRMERNARAGRGVGRVVSGLGLSRGIPSRGGPRGRGRGIGGGRGMVVAGQLLDDALEPDETFESVPALLRDVENSSDTMPYAVYTSPLTLRGHPEVSDIGSSEDDREDDADLDAAMQLRIEDELRTQPCIRSPNQDSHRSKRRRTESVVPITVPADDSHPPAAFAIDQSPQITSSRSASASKEPEQSTRSQSPAMPSPHPINNAMIIDSKISHAHEPPEPVDDLQEDAEEEYVVEAIHEHYHDGTQNMYLVKWEGYENSFDWLPEDDLSGAAELVEEYHKKLRRRAEKGKRRA